MVNGNEIIFLVPDRQDRDQFRRKNWAGTFEEYLNIVRDNPFGCTHSLPTDLRHDSLLWKRC